LHSSALPLPYCKLCADALRDSLQALAFDAITAHRLKFPADFVRLISSHRRDDRRVNCSSAVPGGGSLT
jgi:hypothetical protein